MIRTRSEALKLLTILELLRAEELAVAAGAGVNMGAWSVTEDPAAHIRKLFKAIAEAIFPTATVNLNGNRVEVNLNERQSIYMALLDRRTSEAADSYNALIRAESFRVLLSSAANEIMAIQGLGSGAASGHSATAPRHLFSIEASLDTVRARAQGTYDYAAQVSDFITHMSTVKRVLESVSTAIPNIAEAIANVEETIRMETRRAQAATLSAMDNIIASLTGEPVVPTSAPISVTVEVLPAAASARSALVPGSVIEANGIRYEVASSEEQRRAEEIAARILGR